jgi:hypothetical protein
VFACEECRAIYRELRDAGRRDVGSFSEGLAAWVQQLNEEECARMREDSILWNAWRRMQEHRTLTGHWLPLLPVPPGAISNPN